LCLLTSEAFSKRRMETVYKYCSGRGAAILENLEIKITPPNEFNDPFEFTPRMITSDPVRRAEGILNNEGHIGRLYNLLKSEKGTTMSFTEFQEYVRLNRSTMINGLAQFIPLAAAQMQRAQELLNKASKEFGVLCVSTRRDSILMWGHYGDRHRGVVIGFDGANDVFHPKGTRGLGAVRYVRERVVFDGAWEEFDPKIKVFDEQIIFSKNEDWRYEEELRAMFMLAQLRKGLSEDGSNLYLLPVPAQSIVSVTLGARCPENLEQQVRSALKQPSLSHVTLDRAVLHQSQFALSFEGG